MSCLREVQTISKSPDILPLPSLRRFTTGGVLNPLKNTTNTGHNELLHQDPLQPPLEPRWAIDEGMHVGGGFNALVAARRMGAEAISLNFVGHGILCYLAKHMTSRSH